MARYTIGFLLALGLIFVVIVLIIRGLVSGPSGPKALDLNSYAETGGSVVLTIDSPVSAAAEHSDIVVSVNNVAATLRVTRGYDNETVRTQTYPMNASAYAVFLRALTLNGYTKGDSNPDKSDERGQCALGSRLSYDVIDPSGNTVQHYWHTTCGGGTFNGDSSAIRRLFVAQIPDYNRLTNDIRL